MMSETFFFEIRTNSAAFSSTLFPPTSPPFPYFFKGCSISFWEIRPGGGRTLLAPIRLTSTVVSSFRHSFPLFLFRLKKKMC